jgi:hypothetical protein
MIERHMDTVHFSAVTYYSEWPNLTPCTVNCSVGTYYNEGPKHRER